MKHRVEIIVGTILAWATITAGCGGSDVAIVRNVVVCSTVVNCTSGQGDLHFVALGSGNYYLIIGTDNEGTDSNIAIHGPDGAGTTIFDYTDHLSFRADGTQCSTFDLKEGSDRWYPATGLRLDRLTFLPSNQSVALNPTITNIDFSQGVGDVTFDCKNPSGGGDAGTQLAILVAKQALHRLVVSQNDSHKVEADFWLKTASSYDYIGENINAPVAGKKRSI